MRRAHCQRYLRQSVQLTGFDCPTFVTYIDKLRQLHDMFGRHVPEGKLQPLSIDDFQAFNCLNIATRYFSSRHDNPHGASVPFTRSIDPRGILRNMTVDQYFHGEDNEVQYYVAQSHAEPFNNQM
jgi:hypothetical protein